MDLQSNFERNPSYPYFFYFGVISIVFVLKHKHVIRKQTESVTGFEVHFRI